MSENFNWTCPHCKRPQTVTSQNNKEGQWTPFVGKTNWGNVGTRSLMIACQNPECMKIFLHVSLLRWESIGSSSYTQFVGEVLGRWQLIPESNVVLQPDYIPKPLRDDYYEACRIRDLSPKASATLTRRCLQGMIRDFCKITDETLDKEIKRLTSLVEADKAPRGVTPESVEAIDHVRKIGNIGAHMEKDINLIVDIDPDEAQMLLELVETLFEEWYIARKTREERFAQLAALRAAKDAQKKAGKPESEAD